MNHFRPPRLLPSSALIAALTLAGCVANNPDYCLPGQPGCSEDGGVADLRGEVPDLSVGGDPDSRGAPPDLKQPPPADLRPACMNPGDCPSDICQPDGTCGDAGQIVYVDNQEGHCTGAHAGTQDDPVCGSSQGIAAVKMTGKKLIHMAGRSMGYHAMDLSDLRVSVYGPGGYAVPAARVEGSGSLSALAVGGSAEVLIDGLEFSGSVTNVVSCVSSGGPSPSLTLHNSRIHFGNGDGIYAKDCKLTLDRSVSGRNGGAGLTAEGASQVTVTNSLLVQNRVSGLVATSGSLHALFSTFADNGLAFIAFGAADCGAAGAADRLIEASLIVNNGRFSGSEISSGCTLKHSAIDEVLTDNSGGNRLSAMPDFVAKTLYELSPTTNSKACCIDQLDRAMAGGVDIDFAGTKRPQGPKWDIGAVETK